MLARDAVETYAAMLEATEPDPGRRAGLHGEPDRLTAQRRAWAETRPGRVPEVPMESAPGAGW
jgi:hypothetical protein